MLFSTVKKYLYNIMCCLSNLPNYVRFIPKYDCQSVFAAISRDFVHSPRVVG
jgi:hypothetical protein